MEETVTEETAEETVTEETAEEAVEGEVVEETTEDEEEEAEEECADACDEADDAAAEGKKEKKLRWKKKDKKDEKIEELTDRLQRTMAEFDNYRKRTDKEKASMYIIGAKEVVEKILPIIDNFERGLASATEEQKADPFVEGFDKIYKQLCKTLEDMGVKAIEAVGKEFDPNFHNAVMHVDDENVGENIVVEEFQKGYMYKDFVVRHSMVKVAN
ncbi:MAG: nucleotide exchange factor GrpE [Lachnospiraceae bacterium]|nr:nucleotide exchange factor GrpE [Lachnospiraceae bacterium]